jgi:oligoendopeptidase F
MQTWQQWRVCGQTGDMSSSDTDLTAADVSWDLSGLLSDVDASSPRELVERAQVLADGLQHYKGTIAHISSDELFEMMSVLSETSELLSRAGHFTTLKFSENTADPEIAAEMQFINEQANSVSTKLLFIDLEWAEVSSERSRELLLGDRFDFCRHHLENMRRYQPHQLSEPEETVLSETSLTGASAWVRLFEEHTSAIEVDLPESLGGKVSLMSALANLHAPDTSSREQAAHAISSALEPGLRTRAFIYNTLLLDKSVDDRLRNYPPSLKGHRGIPPKR